MQRDLELGCLLCSGASVIDGTWDGSNYYGGMNRVGITSLADFARMERRRLWILQRRYLSGKNGVFDGVIGEQIPEKRLGRRKTLF